MDRDPYEVLGVSPDASMQEIKRRWRFLSKSYHPDRFQNDEDLLEAEKSQAEVNAAFQAIRRARAQGSSGKSRQSGQPRAGNRQDYHDGPDSSADYEKRAEEELKRALIDRQARKRRRRVIFTVFATLAAVIAVGVILILRVIQPPPLPPLTFAQMVGLLPSKFRHSCVSNAENVNQALGQTASAECVINGFNVTYTAYTSGGSLNSGLAALGRGFTGPGNCTPEGNGALGPSYQTQAVTFGAHSGTIYCYNGLSNDSLIGWTDQNLPRVLGVIVSPNGYSGLYSDWMTVFAAE